MLFSGITSAAVVTEASVNGLYVGTSGWSYPTWRPEFYPPGTRNEDFLRYYSERFNTVELNTTGYRLPREELFERWAEQTPAGFRFTPKMNAYRSLNVETFAERVSVLGDRLGPIRAVVGAACDEGLLELLLASFDPSIRVAFDLRHDSWDGIEDELPPNAVRVGSFDAPAPFRYIRFREPPYADAELDELAGQLRPLVEAGHEVYCYFRHEDEPTAPRYATRLIELLG
jgi:uncharacterized protein YecE (DUF72 family)